MTRRNKYVGPSSCYAIKEGAYVPRLEGYVGKGGVNLATYFSILALILRDYLRGWTYDSECNEEKMDRELMYDRWRYEIALCYRHEDRDVCDALKKATWNDKTVLEEQRLPDFAEVYLAGPNAEKVAEDLVRMGIARWSQIHILGGRHAEAVPV